MRANRERAAILRTLAVFAFTWGVADSAWAGLVLESSGIYGLSNVKLESTYASTNYFAGIFAGATMSKQPSYLIGFRVDKFAQNVSATGGTVSGNLSGLDYGAHVGIILGKAKALHIGGAYFPYITGTASENGTSLGTYYGTGYQAEVAFAPHVARSTFLGGKLAYRVLSVKRVIDSGEESQTVSYSASTLIPTIFISVRFGEE